LIVNVRELQNVVEQADVLAPEALPNSVRRPARPVSRKLLDRTDVHVSE